MGSPTENPIPNKDKAGGFGVFGNTGESKKNEVTFWDHLEVLRRKLLTVLGICAVAAVLFFAWGDFFVQLLLRLPEELGIDLIYIKPQEKFISYLRIAVYLSMVVGGPVLILELLSFVMPALNRREVKVVVPATVLIVLLYAGGIFFAYFFLFPYALGFFIEFGTDSVRAAWSIGEYIRLLGSILLVCGIIFLLPVVLWVFVKTGLLELYQLRRGRKYVLLGLFIGAALFTPPDPFTQIVVAAILYSLYEITILLVRVSEYLKGEKHE